MSVSVRMRVRVRVAHTDCYTILYSSTAAHRLRIHSLLRQGRVGLAHTRRSIGLRGREGADREREEWSARACVYTLTAIPYYTRLQRRTAPAFTACCAREASALTKKPGITPRRLPVFSITLTPSTRSTAFKSSRLQGSLPPGL